MYKNVVSLSEDVQERGFPNSKFAYIGLVEKQKASSFIFSECRMTPGVKYVF